jgi:hypothetical protein
MRNIVIIFLVLLAVLATAMDGAAHSRKGLVKTTLHSDQPTVDEVAYYLEAMVNQRKDEQGRQYRYILWEFLNIERKEELALVHVLINDQKTDQQTVETLYLERNGDGTWNHVDASGGVIAERIYTMVKPDYAPHIAMGCAAVGLCAALAWVLVRRRRNARAKTQAL